LPSAGQSLAYAAPVIRVEAAGRRVLLCCDQFHGARKTARSLDLVMDLVYFLGMVQVSVHEAKTNLSRLLRRVAAGEEIVIARSGRPVARLVPLPDQEPRELGTDKGAFDVPPGFDAPLPEEVLESFER
jgi:prevent-host-death family protein